MLCPNDAIALFVPALPARTLDKPGAPVGMLKFQFDPLPSPLSGILSQASIEMCEMYRACRLSLCLRPFESFVPGGFAGGEGQKKFGTAQGQRLILRYLGQQTYSKVISEMDDGLCWPEEVVAYSGTPTCSPSPQSASVLKSGRSSLFCTGVLFAATIRKRSHGKWGIAN